jgi:hypothetical protein
MNIKGNEVYKTAKNMFEKYVYYKLEHIFPLMFNSKILQVLCFLEILYLLLSFMICHVGFL